MKGRFHEIWCSKRPHPKELSRLMYEARNRATITARSAQLIDPTLVQFWQTPTTTDMRTLAEAISHCMQASAREGREGATLFVIPLYVFARGNGEEHIIIPAALRFTEQIAEQIRLGKRALVAETDLYRLAPTLLKQVLEAHEVTIHAGGEYYGLTFIGSGNQATGPMTSVSAVAEWRHRV